jgi:superfamily II DNA helicase RecQ
MSRKKQRVRYVLDSRDICHLSDEEIKAILRAADELISTGGRSMLAKILKGSKDKKVLEHGLDQCPVYSYYRDFTLQEITNRIDWMIKKGYLEIEYRDRLPVLVFSEIGWEIERETYAEELLQKLTKLLEGKDYSFVQELKDRNRGMILLLIGKIKLTGNARFIPLLKAWKEIEYKKVQTEIQRVIDYLINDGTIF